MRRQRGSRRLPRRLGLWLAAVCATACAQVLGDIQVEKRPVQPVASVENMANEPSGAVSTTTGCEPGDSRCSEDGQLQACVRFEPGAPAGWLNQYNCGSPALCVSGTPPVCRQAACQASEASCSGATPRLCNADLTGWDELPACESAAHCSTEPAECPGGAPCCLVDPCEAGELRCNEGRLEECQQGLAGWAPRATCGTPELCLSGLAACRDGTGACDCQAPACEDGETRCSGSAGLEICNRGRTGWDLLGACGTDALCELGRALSPPRCQPPACTPGEFECSGAVLRSCRDDLTDYEDRDTCVGPAFCNAGAGQCDPAPCEPGERSCNGAGVQVCAQDQSGFVPSGEVCATAELCNDSEPGIVRCEPPQCQVNQYTCFGGNQLQVCNPGRTGFDFAATCLRPDLCSPERRRCDFCFPGRQECTPDMTSSRTCDFSGNLFGPVTFCPLGCNGPTGQCRSCNIGEYICSNGNLQRCNDGRSFAPLNRPTDCSNGLQVSCVNGVVLQSGCPAGLFCGGTGQCVCTPGPAFCSGNDLVVCDGGELVDADQCQGEDGDILTTCDGGDLIEDRCDSARECRQSAGSTCDD